MKPGGGRLKGASFERAVAKVIVKALSKFGITKADCYRTPLSGGHRYAKKEDPGDLVISRRLRQYFSHTVECKDYKKSVLSHFFYLKPSLRECKWLEQAISQETQKLDMLLVFKHDHTMFCCRRLMRIPKSKPSLCFVFKGGSYVVELFKDYLQALVTVQTR